MKRDNNILVRPLVDVLSETWINEAQRRWRAKGELAGTAAGESRKRRLAWERERSGGGFVELHKNEHTQYMRVHMWAFTERLIRDLINNMHFTTGCLRPPENTCLCLTHAPAGGAQRWEARRRAVDVAGAADWPQPGSAGTGVISHSHVTVSHPLLSAFAHPSLKHRNILTCKHMCGREREIVMKGCYAVFHVVSLDWLSVKPFPLKHCFILFLPTELCPS